MVQFYMHGSWLSCYCIVYTQQAFRDINFWFCGDFNQLTVYQNYSELFLNFKANSFFSKYNSQNINSTRVEFRVPMQECKWLCVHTCTRVYICVDCTCVAIDTRVSIVITILQMAMLCKCNNLLNHWFLSAKQSQDCIPLLNSHRIVIFSNTAIGLCSSVNQSSDIQPIQHQYSSESSTRSHTWISGLSSD